MGRPTLPSSRRPAWAIECAALVDAWRAKAELLRESGVPAFATNLERCAQELEQCIAIRSAEDALLTIEQAAAETGYSKSGLYKLIGSGRVPNHGDRGRPRLRRGDIQSLAKVAGEA